MTQIFGGDHTIFKLAVLKLYGEAYAAIMQQVQGLQGVYIDAFAGDGEGITTNGVNYEGSVSVCLGFKPPFSAFHFIDEKRNNINKLMRLPTASMPNVSIHQGDANEFLPKIIQSIDWEKNRGLVFIDPFGLQLDWSTLEIILRDGLIDVWILFPVHGVRRQLTNSFKQITPVSRNRLDQFFGSDAWRKVYQVTPDLFGDNNLTLSNDVNSNITKIYLQQLRNKASYVSDPIELFDSKNIHQFSLIFAMSNQSKKAIKLARRLVSETRQRVKTQFNGGL